MEINRKMGELKLIKIRKDDVWIMDTRPYLKSISSKLPILRGLSTYILGAPKHKGTGGTTNARYCYSVWLRHLVMADKNALPTRPEVIAEIGPGDSLGLGLAGLISGASKYYAFDVVEYANQKRNLEIFDELVELFLKREGIPDETEFPSVKPYLDSYVFPSHILTEKRLNEALRHDRLESIKNAIIKKDNKNIIDISYFVPWADPNVVMAASVDMIYSQAVLEHVEDLDYTYQTLFRWLKPKGFMSHDIDFKSHNLSKYWNGHWSYSDLMWKMTTGKRLYSINRHPYSAHANLLKKNGFEITCSIKTKEKLGITRNKLARKFKNISDDDFSTSTAFIQAIKVGQNKE